MMDGGKAAKYVSMTASPFLVTDVELAP